MLEQLGEALECRYCAALGSRVFFGRPVIVTRPRVGERGQTIELKRFRVARREVTGINYVTVPQGLIESFAPVAARLHGK